MLFILKHIKIKYLLAICILLTAAAIASSSAFAKGKKHKPEVFSSTVEDGTLKVMSAHTALDDDNPLGELHDLRMDVIKSEKKAPQKVVKIAPKQESSTKKFDSIPDQHLNNIANRIKYAYEIAKRFQRAYDYRTTTLSEFQSILTTLEDQELDNHPGNPAVNTSKNTN